MYTYSNGASAFVVQAMICIGGPTLKRNKTIDISQRNTTKTCPTCASLALVRESPFYYNGLLNVPYILPPPFYVYYPPPY